ncbi:MAG: YidC/Oxa1 family membrane protein insertase, partial [Ruminococcaceae bacterium]|nr:YidC/Oxa1 family membrane protein insertase [Oscillospiraceae bacterium]
MFATLGYYICIPFAALVRLFYNLTGSYGVAIILFTLAVKLIMVPMQLKSKKSMIRMNRMQGRMEEIKKKYANNQVKMQEEMQKLYQEEGVNPMGGCLWSFLPLPILIALYSIIREPITRFMMLKEDVALELLEKVSAAGVDLTNIATLSKNGEYAFTPYGQINLAKTISSQFPEFVEGMEGWIDVNYNFLGLDLTVNPWDTFAGFEFKWAVIGLILIPILAGLSQLVMSWYTMRTQNSANASSMKTMMYMMPLLSVYIGFIMPAALGVYWIAQSVFALIQEVLMTKFFNKKIEAEENARYEAIQADRARRMEAGRRQQEERKGQSAQQKKSLKEKQLAAQQAKAEKAAKAKTSTTEAGRVGSRPYARGRAYQ